MTMLPVVSNEEADCDLLGHAATEADALGVARRWYAENAEGIGVSSVVRQLATVGGETQPAWVARLTDIA